MKGTLCYFSLPRDQLQGLLSACYIIQRVMFYKQILSTIVSETGKGGGRNTAKDEPSETGTVSLSLWSYGRWSVLRFTMILNLKFLDVAS